MKFTNGNRKIQESDVINFEKKINHHLPNSYRCFLLNNNGGKPEKGIFSFKDTNRNKMDASQIQMLAYLGIRKRDDTNHLLYLYDMFNKRIPKNYLPVGRDPGGNLILINLKNEKIYFWDHEFEEDIENNINVYYLADNFDDFINKLHN